MVSVFVLGFLIDTIARVVRNGGRQRAVAVRG
jgi:hypothetical protein